jgi:MbtH protein
MTWKDRETEDTTTYKVIVNHEEQYAIWPEFKEIPAGWRYGDKAGAKADCLAHIKEVWTDMRPLSLRQKMARRATSPSPITEIEPPNLVDRLCEGRHAVQIELRPEKTLKLFRESLARDHVAVKFTATNGGSEFGILIMAPAQLTLKADCQLILSPSGV